MFGIHPQYIIALLFVALIAVIVCMVFWQKTSVLEEKFANNHAASESVGFNQTTIDASTPNTLTAQQNMESFTSKHDHISETDVEQYWEISSLKEQNATLETKIQSLREYNEKLQYDIQLFNSKISELESQISRLEGRIRESERQYENIIQ